MPDSLTNIARNATESVTQKIFLAVFCSIIAMLIGNYIRDQWKIRLRIKRIKNSKDKDLYKFYDLYESVFREEVRISSEQFANWIDIDNQHADIKTVSHYHFVCKRGSAVVGFLKVIYSWEYHLLFIAYYAIDKKDLKARELASATMIEYIEKILKKKFSKCKGIIFEVEDIDASKTEEVNNERKARIRLFKSSTKSRGHCAYEIDCNYIQPQIKIDNRDTTADLPLVLMYVSLYKDCSITLNLNKTEVVDIIYFIYFNIYLPYFIHCGEDALKSENHLLELLDTYHKELPMKVSLKH